MKNIVIEEQSLSCPKCGKAHYDIDEWAIKPHKTHLCLHCGELFEGSFKGVSRATFEKMTKPENVYYIPF